MKNRNINFSNIISTIRHEFNRIREHEVLLLNLKRLDYLEGFVLGVIKLIRDCYHEDIKKFSKEEDE